jgi:hypothetical protein
LPDNEQAELSELMADFLASTSYDQEPPPETYFEELREWAEEDD